MPTLLFRLCGPMQSYAIDARFTQEPRCATEPSKSAIVGILAAALGRARGADLADLVALRLGVRVERQGRVATDYVTAGVGQGVWTAAGKLRADGVVRHVAYLEDADFLVGVEGLDAASLGRLDAALGAPVFAIGLGRRAYPPSVPLQLPPGPPWGPGIRMEELEDALRAYPVAAPAWGSLPQRLLLAVEVPPERVPNCPPSTLTWRRDVPDRDVLRPVQTSWLDIVAPLRRPT